MSIEVRDHALSGGRTVRTFDHAIPLALRQDIYARAVQSNFRIGWPDNEAIEHRQHVYLHSEYSTDDLNKLGILLALAPTPVFAELKGYKVVKTVLNLTTAADSYFAHAHKEDKVLLYYVNPEWHTHWYGETLFYDDALKNIDLALPYTPGRVCVFDGRAPHSIRPQAPGAPFFRFTLGLFLNKESA